MIILINMKASTCQKKINPSNMIYRLMTYLLIISLTTSPLILQAQESVPAPLGAEEQATQPAQPDQAETQSDVTAVAEPDQDSGSVTISAEAETIVETIIVSNDQISNQIDLQQSDPVLQVTTVISDIEETINPLDIEPVNEVSGDSGKSGNQSGDASLTDDEKEDINAPKEDTELNSNDISKDLVVDDLDIQSDSVDLERGDQDIDSIEVKRISRPISRDKLNPSRAFKFSISGRKINTKDKKTRSDLKNENINEQSQRKNKRNKNEVIDSSQILTISNSPIITLKNVDQSTIIDNTNDTIERVLNVSGSCSSQYYVILLYRNVDDYDRNPSSYILNKAYECVDGRYSYDINDLPKDISPGTYYLLVGGQDNGPWSPITSLTEIIIN